MDIIKRIFAVNVGLRVSLSENTLFEVEKYKCLKEINSDSSFFKVNPVVFAADPFLFVNDGILYLFYEEQKTSHGKGVIKMINTKDLSNWSEPTTVLREKFHISFPFVFRADKEVFMIPETKEDNSIRLYKSNADFTGWSFYKKILSDNNFVDSSVIFHEGIFFLFTTIHKEGIYSLRLYYSESLCENWIEHPSSPIYVGKKAGRNGGSVFIYNGDIYRPAQNCAKIYGEKLAIYKILELSKENFNEELIYDNILPKKVPFYSLGGHQFNFVCFDDKIIIATDALQYNFNVIDFSKRVFKAIFDKLK